MFRLTYSEIVEKISETTKISTEEIDELVADKLEQLSGLISKEGAAHIIANEKGVKLFEEIAPQGELKIKNISTDRRSVNTVGKVTRIFDVRKFKTKNDREGQVGAFFIGDETGKIRITLWNDQADKLREIKEGDIIKIKNARVKENQGFRELHLNDKSDMVMNPKGVSIEVKESTFAPSTRKKISELQENDENIDLLGHVVQVFNPNFFEVCPQCGRRVRSEEDYNCQQHGKVTPIFSYVLNASVDDGSGVIRTAFYRNQVLRLFNSKNDDFLKIKDNPEEFEELRNDVVGSIIKVVGKTRRNPMSNDLEFTSNLVFTNPNPEEEAKALK